MADLETKLRAEIAKMRPYLERSGGRLELVGVEDSVAKVLVTLTRPGASMLVASLQLASGIERTLRNAIPELRGVEAVNLPPHVLQGWDQPGSSPAPAASNGTRRT